jgi:hypothetical protein
VMKEWITVQWTPNGKYRKGQPKWLIITYYWQFLDLQSHILSIQYVMSSECCITFIYTFLKSYFMSECNAMNYNLHHTHVSTFNCPHFVCFIYYLPYMLNAILLLSLIMWVQLCFSSLMDVTISSTVVNISLKCRMWGERRSVCQLNKTYKH